MLADLSLSLDNVLALAAVAQGDLALLLLGLLLSIPLLMFGDCCWAGCWTNTRC